MADSDPNRQEVPPTSHVPGSQPYSGTNPIPNVQRFYGEILDRKRREDELRNEESKAQRDKNQDEGQDQRKWGRHKEQQQDGQEQGSRFHHGNGTRRKVFDPVTGSDEVVIEDMTKGKNGNEKKGVGWEREDKVTVPLGNVIREHDQQNSYPPQFPGENNTAPQDSSQPPAQTKTSPHQHPKEYAEAQDITAPPEPMAPHSTTDVPIHGDKTNLLFHPTPTLSLSATEVIATLESKTQITCLIVIACVSISPFLLPGTMAPQFRWTTFSGLIMTGIGVALALWFWMKKVIEQARNVDWASEKQRGEIGGVNLVPESVEWLNRLIGVGWQLANPEMFASIADMIEDVMQATVPGVIGNVRIADISQGATPLRILSLRSLPDKHVKDLKSNDHEHAKDEEQRKADEQGGEWYNLEASVAYHADPSGKGVSTKAKNMHLLVVFYVGIRGLVGVPIPIWVELKGLVATARIRLQLTPDPPFLKTLTFTLMGVPQISVSCVPMTEKGINVLDLPLISSFVDNSIATVANEYVAPKSMSLDLAKMLEGDDVKKDTEAMGVLVIEIKRAVGLSRQDRSKGGCDAYVTLGFSKYGKPMYSTRVIVGDLNPIWEETAFILVHPNYVKTKENLSVELWDSDRFTADDMVGKVELPLETLLKNPGEMHPQTTTNLSGLEHDSSMPGKLIWSVGYFPKAGFRPALRTGGKDVQLAPELQKLPELQDDKGSLDSKVEDAVMHTPPDPLWPCGIVSVIIHQIVGLEVQNRKGSFEKKKDGMEFSPGQETGEIKEEEGEHLPSCYCTIILNDELIYRTRTKAVTSRPIFNAGTERFIRDWRSSIITVTARDSRLREHDPILGVIPIKLSDILQTTSQVTRWFPLDAGLGFGRARISVLFRSTSYTIPPQLTGWNVGTWEFTSEYIVADGYQSLGKIKLRTGGSTGHLSASVASRFGEDAGGAGHTGVRWDVRKKVKASQKSASEMNTSSTSHTKKLRLPVRHRYMSPVVFDIYETGIVSKVKHPKQKPVAHALLWLQTVVDNEIVDIDIPIYTTSDPQRLCENFITDPAKDDPELKIKEVGRLKFQGLFRPGMDCDHKRFIADNDSRETFETWEACRSEGIRGDNDGVVKVGRVIDGLHERSIAEMKSDLVKTEKREFAATRGTGLASIKEGGDIPNLLSEEEKARLTDKYGKDWNEIFSMAMEQLAEKNRNKRAGSSDRDIENSITATSSRRDSGAGGDWHYLRNHDYDHTEYDSEEDYASSDSDSDTPSYPENENENEQSPQSSRVQPLSPSPSPEKDKEKQQSGSKNPITAIKNYRSNQRNLHRRHQGLMQWKPMRGIAFAKDGVKFGARRMKQKVSLGGRQPDVETEV